MRRTTTEVTQIGMEEATGRPEKLVREGDRWILHSGQHGDNEALGLVPALDKAIRTLSFVNASGGGVTLAEIADATGIGRSHCHSILKTLAHHGWLAFDGQRKTYRLHAGILRDLSSVMGEYASPYHIRPALERLSERAGVSCILSQPLPDGTFLVVDKVSAPRQLELTYPVGHRFPLDASAQMKANLAWRSEQQIGEWLRDWIPMRHTPRTIVTAEALRAELEIVRRQGYARSIGEFTEGLMVLALPLFDQRGEVIFVFACLGLIGLMRDRETEIAEAMSRTAAEIHQLVGGLPPGPSRADVP